MLPFIQSLFLPLYPFKLPFSLLRMALSLERRRRVRKYRWFPDYVWHSRGITDRQSEYKSEETPTERWERVQSQFFWGWPLFTLSSFVICLNLTVRSLFPDSLDSSLFVLTIASINFFVSTFDSVLWRETNEKSRAEWRRNKVSLKLFRCLRTLFSTLSSDWQRCRFYVFYQVIFFVWWWAPIREPSQ